MMTLRAVPALAGIADRLSTRKVRVARRIARRANPRINFVPIPANVTEPGAAMEFTDCRFLFLAAEWHLARMVFNAITHQFLIAGIQMGTRIDVDKTTGSVAHIQTSIRLVLPYTAACAATTTYPPPAATRQTSLPRLRNRRRQPTGAGRR